MRTRKTFSLPDGFDEQRFIDSLSERFAIQETRPLSEKTAFYDTFDWRLFNKSLVLYSSGNALFLRKLQKSQILHSTAISTFPVFIWDFPEGALRDRLTPVIKMRALLKLVELQSKISPYRILDRNQKTVTHLAFEQIRPYGKRNAPVLATTMWLKPVRGYAKYSRNLVKHFQALGMTECKNEDLFFDALKVVDKKPGSYSAKVAIKLEPDMRSDVSTKTILQFLANVMRINEANLARDIDTEILHDFRVAIRRTRSALGQIKNVFPQRTTNRFKKDFAFVGKLSNELRDLDVYLLDEESYKAMLPPVLRDDIDPLFDHLRKKRSRALQAVLRGLKTKKYAKIMQDWEAFLEKTDQSSATAVNAELPVIDLARKRIDKKYRGVVKAGILILQNTEDEMLHALRIDCKKLRYLMEFFSSLFASNKINALIAQLKKLQDNLGDFNDLCVQVDYLLDISEELPANARQLRKTLVAIGSLIGTLDRKRVMVKDAFAETFTEFASQANQDLFRELFSLKPKPDKLEPKKN
jgi:CHAD domain-containing protein